MPSPFAAQTMSLGQLFSNPNFIHTPAYQRSFSWEEKEAGRLLEDLVAALDAGAQGGRMDDYFLGTMLFIEPERTPSRLSSLRFARQPRALEVVDGLQRLTTLTILFCVIRDLARSGADQPHERLLTAIGTGQKSKTRPRLTLQDRDQGFFHTYVRAPGATRVAAPESGLTVAQDRILEVRDHLIRSVEELDADQHARLADFLLDRCHVVVVSTTGIDRAHRMFTVLNDSGKALGCHDILKADLLGAVPPAAMERAAAAWDDAKARLDEHFDPLFSHIRAMYARSSPQVIEGIRSIAAEAGGGLPFIERILQPAAGIFEDILSARHSGSPHSRTISSLLTYLGWLRGQGDWVPPVIMWWLAKGDDPAELAWFLAALDRLAYGLRILEQGNKRRGNRFGAVMHAIRHGRDLRGPTGPLHLSRDELRTIHHNLRDLHARSAPLAKLVLLRLNDHLAGSPQGVPFEDLSVEHLLPRKPGVNSPWRDRFPDLGERDRCTESLGNLVLVTRAQNDKAGNSDFLRKKDVLFKAGAPALPVNAYVREQKEWTPRQIREREAMLLDGLDKLWGFGPAPTRPEPPRSSGSARRAAQPQAVGA
jgi:hypothetical protein